MELSAGQEVDRYEVLSQLGEGGMAVVYKVRHRSLGTLHALKVLSLTKRGIRERLLQEGRVQATLKHPNLVAVTDVLEVGGAPCLLMEYIAGPSLERWIRNYRPSHEEAMAVFRGIVSGVAHAHAQGVIHRDLKPANVLLHIAPHGVIPKVSDFGLAKALDDDSQKQRTRTGATMGTPAYMAPEQMRDASNVDLRADLFSLGCILHELLSGEAPFSGPDIISLFNAVITADYPAPEALDPAPPAPVSQAIRTLLEAEPDKRFSSCEELFAALGEGTPPPGIPLPLVLTTLPSHGAAAAAARELAKSGATGDWVSPNPSPTWTESLLPTSEEPQTDPAPDERQAQPEAVREEVPVAPVAPAPPAPSRLWGLLQGAMGAVFTLASVVVIGVGWLAWSALQPAVVDGTDPARTARGREGEIPSDRVEPAVPRLIEVTAPVDHPDPPVDEPVSDPSDEGEGPSATPPDPTAPPAGSSKATVSFEGARTVWLVDFEGAKYPAPDPISPGTYDILAWFDGPDPVAAGRVTVGVGETVTLRCEALMARCRR